MSRMARVQCQLLIVCLIIMATSIKACRELTADTNAGIINEGGLRNMRGVETSRGARYTR